MISLKYKTGFVLTILLVLLAGNIGVYNSCFGGPLRRLAKMEMEKKMQKQPLVMYSSAFKNGEKIPTHYTADEANVSPPLSWGVPPAGTKSFALICEDPDAPMGTWTHWIIYDIPPDKKGLEQGIPAQGLLADGTQQGINSFKKIGYSGPSPPPGKPHRYFFKLYALNWITGPIAGKVLPMDAKAFHSCVKEHALAESDLMGTYSR